MKNKKVILVTLSPKTHRTSEENLGLEYLKACLVKNEYEVEIIDAWLNNIEVNDVYKKIISDEDNILFVGISSYMGNTNPTIELVKLLKDHNENIKIASGGFGPTFFPEKYLGAGVDYIMRGEGEKTICELADCINNHGEPINIKNVGYKNSDGEIILNEMECLNDNLDSIPFPSRDTLDVVLNKKSSVNMVTSRGCSGNCEFCSVISFFRLSDGKIWRTRSIKNIVDEIEELHKKGVKYIKFVDDSFIDGIRDENWCKEFADEINNRNINVKLRGQIRADKVTDKILYYLKKAGFFSFACGIENGSESALRRMNKKATLEDNKRTLELFKKHGYIVQMGYILFDNETTYEELVDNYNFLSEYDYAVTKGIFSEMYSTEGTKLNDRLKKENKLIETNTCSNNKYEILNNMVYKVYSALKTWQKSHRELYDMTIDPLTAPKAIEQDEMTQFYNYAISLKKMDLMIFKDLLLQLKNNPDIDLDEYIDMRIKETMNNYDDVNKKVKVLYNKCGLIYDGNENPYI